MARSFGVICAPPESHQSGSSLGEILLPQNTSNVPPKEPSRYPPPPARQLEVSQHQNGISLCALPPLGLPKCKPRSPETAYCTRERPSAVASGKEGHRAFSPGTSNLAYRPSSFPVRCQ